ncbi:MAG TPA: hypothetical protein VIH99_03785 [Bdellovibrionota bacterium]|jgi:hypothetical protein
MRSNGWTLRSKRRLLELSIGGRWYLAFTIALGTAAIYSGNNVIYLLESLLLSSLLVSGVFSEITLSNIHVERECGNLHAGLQGMDVFIVENRGRLPLYCIELGEYLGRRREFTAFLLILPARARVRVRSRQVVPSRGRHHWEGLLAGTSFPFGFARKIMLIPQKGNRIVWPRPADSGKRSMQETPSVRGEAEVITGEVVPTERWKDATRVHWPVSARVGEWMARPVRNAEPREEVWLELREPGPEMENKISKVTGALVKRADTLVMMNKGERQRVSGRHRALDALALLPKESA